MLLVEVELPIRTATTDNRRGNRYKLARIAEKQRADAHLGMMASGFFSGDVVLPVIVEVVRVGPRRLDPHNLGSALKHVIDGIADWLGVDDGDKRLLFRVGEQIVGPPAAVLVRVLAP